MSEREGEGESIADYDPKKTTRELEEYVRSVEGVQVGERKEGKGEGDGVIVDVVC